MQLKTFFMKKLIFLTLLFVCFKTNILLAQSFINNTTCDVTVEAICYDDGIPGCPIVISCGTVVSVPSMTTKALPSSCCSGTPAQQLGYRVIYTSGACMGTTLIVNAWGTTSNCYGVSVSGNCPPCNGGTAFPLQWMPPSFVDLQLN
jgi:hypothetical protein